MIATLISILFSFILIIQPGFRFSVVPWDSLAIGIVASSFALFFIYYFISSSALAALQKGERNVTSHLMQIYHKDSVLGLTHLFFVLFPLLTFFLALTGLLLRNFDHIYLISVWVILFGLALDLLRHTYKKIANYLDPYSVIKLFTNAARRSIQDENEGDLCDWIDALSETALKAVEHFNISLCNESLAELQVITRNFLESQKSIGHPASDAKEMGISDKVSFTLFYIFQRLEMINDKAIQNGLEPASSAVITNLGKIVTHAARCDISLAVYPIYILGKCARKAQSLKFPEAGNKATLTLLEVAKAIPEGIDITYLELKDPYLTLVSQIHELAKESFRQDKSINISSLTQPFRILSAMFEEPRLANHPDTPAILNAIKQVQSEFDALELVMKTIPPLPTFPAEEGEKEIPKQSEKTENQNE